MWVSSFDGPGGYPSWAGLWKLGDGIVLGGAQLKRGGGRVGIGGCFSGIAEEVGDEMLPLVDANSWER